MTATFDPKRIAFIGADFGDLERRLMAHLALHHRPFDYKDMAIACLGEAYGMSPTGRQIRSSPALGAPYHAFEPQLHDYQRDVYRMLMAKPTKAELAFQQTLNATWRQIGKQDTRLLMHNYDFRDIEYDGTTGKLLRYVYGDLKTGHFWEEPMRPSRPLSPTLERIATSLKQRF